MILSQSPTISPYKAATSGAKVARDKSGAADPDNAPALLVLASRQLC